MRKVFWEKYFDQHADGHELGISEIEIPLTRFSL